MSSAREQLIAAARHMTACGLNSGTAGNISVRHTEEGIDGFLITPTGMNYDALVADDIVFMRLDGTPSAADTRRPSSEWRLHRDLYAARAPAGAIAHAHSPFATSLACLRHDIPPFHYMIARFGGDTLRCADYATSGTQALSDAALLAMQGRQACLLANHGMLVWGRGLDQALALASELETLCQQYWRACAIGSPALLAVDEMATVLEKFADYGRQD